MVSTNNSLTIDTIGRHLTLMQKFFVLADPMTRKITIKTLAAASKWKNILQILMQE